MNLDDDFDDLDGPSKIPPRTFKFKPKSLKIKPKPTGETQSEPPQDSDFRSRFQNSEPQDPQNVPVSRKNQDEEVEIDDETNVDPMDEYDEYEDEDEDEEEDMDEHEYQNPVRSPTYWKLYDLDPLAGRRYFREVRVKRQSREVHYSTNWDQGKKCVIEDADFISKLPDELLHKILANASLSLRDVVGTSILSRRWRYLSASVSTYKPLLRFNCEEMFMTRTKQYEFWEAKGSPCIDFERKVRIAVNNYIRCYRGEKIDLFEFNFCLCSKHMPFYTTRYADPPHDDVGSFFRHGDGDGDVDVDGWIKFALSKGVESLTLFGDCLFDCCNALYYCYYYGKNCAFQYFFRIVLFEGIATRSLKHLKLSSCLLGPNFTNQLSSLETLSLDNIGCLAWNLESMFPFLGKLKTLEITNSTFRKKILSVVSLPLLENFLVRRIRFLEEIELSNPHLVDFKCLVGDDELKCNLSGARNLTSLSYLLDFMETHLDVLTNLQCHQELRNLTLVTSHINWDDSPPPPRRYDLTMSQVTHLNLYILQYSLFSFVWAMSILKAFPHLRAFRLIMVCPEDVEDEINIEHDLSYVPEYLKEVLISHFYCTKLEMQFAMYLLKYSSALEKLSIVLPPEKLQLQFDEGPYCGMTCRMVADTLRKFDTANILDVQTDEENRREDTYYYYGLDNCL